MSTERDTDRLLRQWLDEGPTRAADRLVETVEERIDRQPQRPAWRLAWRTLLMNRTVGSFAAGMAVVAIVLIGFNVLLGQSPDDSIVGGPAQPSSVIAITPSAASFLAPPSAGPPGEGGLKWSFAGRLPDGWEQIDTEFHKGDGFLVEVREDVSVMATDCVYGPEQGTGRTASEVVAALTSRPGLEVTGPEPVDVGGLNGDVLDLALSQDWTGTCPWYEPGGPMVPTYGAFDEKNYWQFNAVAGDDRWRVYVLQVPGGGNVVIHESAVDPELWAANEAEADEIVRGIEFDFGS